MIFIVKLIFSYQNLTDLKFLSTSESFDGRDKPSVLVTSPGSPDFNYQQKLQPPGYHPKRPLGRYQRRLMQPGAVDPNVGGRIQIKLGFEANTLQLIVTMVCAADLTYRPNQAARNPYAKVNFKLFPLKFKLNNFLCRYSYFLVIPINANDEQKL